MNILNHIAHRATIRDQRVAIRDQRAAICNVRRVAIGGLCRLLGLSALAATVSAFVMAAPASAQAPSSTDFQRTAVAEGLDLPMEFEISTDGRVFVVGKCGKLYAWRLDGGTAAVTATVPNVRCVFEDGLLSVALDPAFTQNNFIYFQYTAPGSKTRVSRFTVNASNGLVAGSEAILLEWTTGSEAHGHMGGSLKFDKSGNLLITTGDNNAASGYFSEGAQETSGNTNDLRGKVLRIRPTPEGGYTIPAGNLFPGDASHRPEIYGMGFRNPFRLNVDPLTGYAYVGDIGPDASAASAEGPGGMDELHELRGAGNYGWPYIVGFNQPYAGFNPTNIVNNHPRNTGAKNLPPAIPALWTIRHQATMAGPVYRFNEAITNEFKLPAYYDGRLIFWDFNSSKFSTLNLASTASPPVAEDFPLNTANFQGAIDVELDPRTHQLYVLQWGSGCCDKEPYGNGILYRFDYIGDRDNGTNVAIGGVADASSEVGGNLARYAVDGDPATRWESASSDPQSLNIDLGTATTIATIVIKWEAAFSSQYFIEGSVDGTTWERLVTNNTGSGNTELHMVNSSAAYRYLRFTGTARASGYGHSIYEFEVFAGPEAEQPLTEFAYLNMPKTLDSNFTGVPRLLSQTGVFSDTPNRVPNPHLLPFSPNSQLYSDNATKARWISLPATTKIKWDAKENWVFPQGTVVVKNFDLPTHANNSAQHRRLETRLLVVKADGKVYGVTYRWRPDNSDADLLTTGAQQDLGITQANGATRTQTWSYPSPSECLDCHNPQSGQILGLSTRQLNGNYAYPGGATENQLTHWNRLNLFTPAFNTDQVAGFDKMVALDDTSASLETRVKSYLDANCAHCHGTGNGGSQWDARFNTPLSQMKIVNLATTGIRNYQADYGLVNAKVVAAGAPQESVLYIRDKSIDPNDRMPPLGRSLEHREYIELLDQWISRLSAAPPQQAKELLSRGKPVTSSSVEGGFVASHAVDGDPLTRWGSEFADPQWIQIDLQAAQDISEIKLVWETAYGKSYQIQGSLDGAQWTSLVTKTNGTGGTEIHNNLSGSFRYIRLNGTSRGTVWGYSLFEFEVWGGKGSSPEQPPQEPPSGPTPGPAKLVPVEATSSSVQGGNTANYAFDANPATRWESASSDDQHIQLDMGKSVHFTQVVLHWEAAYGKHYVIEVSPDGNSWEIARSVTNSDGGVDTLALDGQLGRYIRMRGLERATGYGYSLFEFEVHAVPASAELPQISFLSPASNAVLTQGEPVTFQVAISDPNWLQAGAYVYSLNNQVAVLANNLNEINLGSLPTGQHSLRVSLVNSQGAEVSVPRVRHFRVSCGNNCPKVLVFSKTAGFRHDSIAAGIAMVQQIAQDHGYSVTVSEDSSLFTSANLAQYSTIVFMNTTGDIFNASQEAAFKTYMENGGGFVGTHAAADTEHDWDWYTDTLFAGAEFIHHGDGIPHARIQIEKPQNSMVQHIGTEWMLGDEWYFWKTNPRAVGSVEVLGTLDRSSYNSNYPVADHPVIFTNTVGSGRMFYTAIGHVDANFSDPHMVEMIRKAIEWTSQ